MKTNKHNRYPVSMGVCSECSSCVLVTETITGYPLSEDEQYYQCISDMVGECMDMNIEVDCSEYDILFPIEVSEDDIDF